MTDLTPTRVQILSQHTVQSRGNTTTTVKAGEQTDFFISQLKQEIYELRQRQRDHSQLQEQLHFLRQKYNQQVDDHHVFESDCQHNLRQNHHLQEQLISELDSLKEHNEQIEDEQVKLLDQISQTNDDITHKTVELRDLLAKLEDMENRNFIEQKDLDRLDAELREATSVSIKYQAEIQRLRDINNARDLDIRGFKSRLAQMEAELEANQRRLAHLNEVREQTDEDIAAVTQKINHTYAEIQSLKAKITQITNEINYFEEQNHTHQQNQIHLSKINEQEYFRGKDLAGIESEKRAALKAREDELANLKFELDQVKMSNQKYLADQHDLESEIVALQRHVSLITQQNYELSTELEQFIETDDSIRRQLNRKGKVEEIRHKVDEAILRSMHEVEQRRSPDRRQRRESPPRY